MKNLRELREEFINDENWGVLDYDDDAFMIYIGIQGYRLNGEKPLSFYIKNRTMDTMQLDEFFNKNNIIVTNIYEKIKNVFIQELQNNKFTFSEMNTFFLFCRTQVDKLNREKK